MSAHRRRAVEILITTAIVVCLGDVSAAEQSAIQWQERPIVETDDQALPPVPTWFRSWLRVPDNMAGMSGTDLWRDSMTLTLQNMPGPVAVSINGQSILETANIPTGEPRRFKVPRGIFHQGSYNALIIRLDGAKSTRGLTVAPIVAGYFDEVKLSRLWQMTTNQPAETDMRATPNAPAVAAYTEQDFHPGTSVMQANADPERGLFVPPEEALRNLQPENDLIVEELLHEPQVAQPTHVSFDARGRLWVAQYRQYPYPAGVRMISRDKYYRSKYDRVPPPPPRHDRGADIISVHEDRDGDGRYDTHREVITGLNMANAVVSGHGGLWVMHTPYLLFYPDADADDVPDVPPEVRLQGFGLEDTHSVANGLAWGPDGWLYGAQGSTTTSRVIRPGADSPDAPGVYVEGCMVWRYHPERRLYEIFADGGGNTFGVSFDAEGRLFTGHNGGDTRGWHHIQEGIYLKQGKDPGKFGPPANPFAFGELPMMRSAHPIPRFTHMTIMGEGTALPPRWRGQFLAVDPLHHRVVASAREPVGSTFQTTDTGFPLRSDDLTFRPVYLANAPDGSLVIADFREEYIAHGQNYQSQIDPASGRIYRLRGKDLPMERDLNVLGKSPQQWVALLSHDNLWHRHTAVRLLGERRDADTVPWLLKALENRSTHPALEALWALHQMGRLEESLAMSLLDHPASPVRAWTIRLVGDERSLPPSFAARLATVAAIEPDAEVRSQILSTARRLPAAQALPLVKTLARRSEDTEDPFIPLMAWFVLETHCAERREDVLALFDDPSFWSAPMVRQHLLGRLMRRLAASGTRQEFVACAMLLDKAPSEADRETLIRGFEEAFRGRAVPSLPDQLMEALADSARMTLILRVRRKEPDALNEALRQAGDGQLDLDQRLAAIRVFGEIQHAPAVPVLLGVATGDGPASLRAAACAALLPYDDPSIGDTLAKSWPALPAAAQSAALNLLSSRATWGLQLLESVSEGQIPIAAVSEDMIGRLRLHQNTRLEALLENQFPSTPPVAGAALLARINVVRRVIENQPGDPYKGEPLFNTLCGACHTLFFKGGKIGPDLTSYQRDDLDTMLLGIMDPNAAIREGYENHLIVTKDGQTLGGFLADQDAHVIVLRGVDGADVSLSRSNIATMTPAGRSLMPESLLDGLADSEIRDLFAYLRQSQPITK